MLYMTQAGGKECPTCGCEVHQEDALVIDLPEGKAAVCPLCEEELFYPDDDEDE